MLNSYEIADDESPGSQSPQPAWQRLRVGEAPPDVTRRHGHGPTVRHPFICSMKRPVYEWHDGSLTQWWKSTGPRRAGPTVSGPSRAPPQSQ